MNLYSHFEIAFIYAKHITLDIAFRGEHKFQNIAKIQLNIGVINPFIHRSCIHETK